MARGLFVGLTTVDLFNVVASHPLPDQKTKALHQAACAGGPAANAAVAFSAFENEADLITGLGHHPTAALALEDLQKHGVIIHDYSTDPGEFPILSSIIIDSSNGSRCVVYSNPHQRTLSPNRQFELQVDDYAVILFDGFYLEQAIAIAKAVQGGSAITVLDGGSWKEGLEKLLPYMDYVICSADFRAPGCKSDQDLLRYFEEIGVLGSAISRGAEPIIYSIERSQYHLPVPQVDAIDTLGAGDILHGVFCHHILTNPFPRSLELAALCASRSCLSYGTREWIVNR